MQIEQGARNTDTESGILRIRSEMRLKKLKLAARQSKEQQQIILENRVKYWLNSLRT